MFFSFLFLFLLFFPFFSHALLITEVQVAGEKNINECYIKIYNPKEEDVFVGGYSLRKKTSTGNDVSLRVFPQESIVRKKDYFIWGSSKEKSFLEKIDADVKSSQYLAHDNSIAFFDNNNHLVDALAWGDGKNPYLMGLPLRNPENGEVIKRRKENGNYLRTGNNLSDFYIKTPFPQKKETKEVSIEKEGKRKSPVFYAIITSLILSFIIFYFKKCQDTVTQKT